MMHIFSMKGKTKQMAIKPVPDAEVYYVPLLQHIGAPAQACVAVGDRVEQYQLIGQSANGLSANIHTPVSGVVQAIENKVMADGSQVPMVVIANDFESRTTAHESVNVDNLSPDAIVDIIRDKGIVGEGGAQFPTAVKYALDGAKIDTFIINGTECEPYLSADYALMNERTEQLFNGIYLINKILKAEDVVISIEKQNKELQTVFEPFLNQQKYNNIRIKVLPNEYPQGGELQLIKSVTGIELPRNKRPREVGVIVSNVGTVYAVHEAVANNKPLTSRIITISGKAQGKEGNYEVKIGTPISHILQSLNLSDENKTLVLGGPMMGKHITDFSAPIVKGSSGVLFFEQAEVKRSNCISCGYCVDVCPMHLMPMKFEEIYRKKRYGSLTKYGIAACIECAACEYICPSNVPLIESIKEGKIKLKQMADAILSI